LPVDRPLRFEGQADGSRVDELHAGILPRNLPTRW